jgi:hypothetical protein
MSVALHAQVRIETRMRRNIEILGMSPPELEHSVGQTCRARAVTNEKKTPIAGNHRSNADAHQRTGA